MNYIKKFSELNSKNVEIAGGKGASLGEMTGAGIPVPEGFVILSKSFEYFIDESRLNDDIDAILDKVNTEEVSSVENASEQIQSLILNSDIPKEIEEKINEEFKELDCKYVAVRSSATSEDSADAAWAGQLDSFLNTTKKTLLINVRRCWASLFTPRAIFYRFEKKLHKEKVSVAVVVQKMIDSQESGIAFSVHPVTQDYNQLIIESGYGLGESIVSGQITPDSYVVDKKDMHITEISVSEQKKGLYKKDGGGNEWKELGDKGKKQVLTQNEILELSKMIINIENHYGFPVDIEWAKEKNKFYIVQSRPITTLMKKEDLKVRWNIIANDFNSFFVRNQIWTKGINQAGKIIPELKPYTQTLAIQGKNGKIDYLVDSNKWKEMHEIFTQIIEKDMDLLEKTILDTNKYGDESIKIAKKLTNNPISKKSNEQLIEELGQLIQRQEMLYAYGVLLPLVDLGEQTYISNKLEEELKKSVKSENVQEIFMTLTRPTEDSFSVEEEKELLKLAIEINKNKTLKKVFEKNDSTKTLEELKNNFKPIYNKIIKHKDKYTWIYYAFSGPYANEQDYIDSLKELMNIDSKKKLEEMNESIKKLKKEKQEIIKKYAKNNFSKRLFELAGTFVWAKPRRKDYQSALYYYIIEYYLNEIAKRIKITREEIISLPFEDINNALLNGSEVNKEKAEQILKHHIIIPESNLQIKSHYNPEELIDIEKTIEIPKTEIISDHVLKGMPAHNGKAIGRVVIINTPQEMKKIQEGDILVSVATTPSIVPAMKKAAAFVTDEGGLTCHAAIVAREMRKPCIVGTKVATTILKDGNMVEVDADLGIVRVIDKSGKDKSEQ